MADEAIITPDQEVKAVKDTKEAIAPEGSVEAELAKTKDESEVVVPKSEPTQETVPLKVFLDLKDDLKDLKKELKEAKSSQRSSIATAGFDDLTKKYPDVSPEFIQDMLSSATTEAAKKIEEKYTPILAKQEAEQKREAFNKAFNNLFDRTLEENPELPKTIDREAVKALASTPQYRNVPLADVLVKLYGVDIKGKASSENDMRTGAERTDDIVSFDKITPEQKKRIMADPKARQKYFDYLDTISG